MPDLSSMPGPALISLEVDVASVAVAHLRELAPHGQSSDVQRQQNVRQGVHEWHANRLQVTRWDKDRKATMFGDEQHESLTAHAEQIRRPVAEASRRGHRLGRWRTNALEHLLRAADHYHGVERYSSSRQRIMLVRTSLLGACTKSNLLKTAADGHRHRRVGETYARWWY
jgi:hypothetical protein